MYTFKGTVVLVGPLLGLHAYLAKGSLHTLHSQVHDNQDLAAPASYLKPWFLRGFGVMGGLGLGPSNIRKPVQCCISASPEAQQPTTETSGFDSIKFPSTQHEGLEPPQTHHSIFRILHHLDTWTLEPYILYPYTSLYILIQSPRV